MDVAFVVIILILVVTYTWRRASQLNGGCSDIGDVIGVFLIFLMFISVGIALLPLTTIFVTYDIFNSLKEKIKTNKTL